MPFHNLKQLDPWSTLLSLTTVLVCSTLATFGTVAMADGVADRQNEYLEAFYQEFDDSALLGVEASVTFNWAYAAMALNKDSAEINQANAALGQYLTDNATLWDTAMGDPATIGSYWDMPTLGYLALDPNLSSQVTGANKSLINQFLHNYSVNTETSDMPSLDFDDELRIFGSDNHDLHRRSIYLTTAKLLKDDPAYADQTYVGGDIPEQRYAKWTNNLMDYFQRRAGQGGSVEVASPTYQGVTMRAVFTIGELAEDDRLGQLADDYTDLIFADMAQETLHGMRGGAKVRAYKNRSFYPQQDRSANYLYLFTGEPSSGLSLLPDGLHLLNTFGATTSDYRVPSVIQSIGTDEQQRGTFQYVTNRLGQGEREIIDGEIVYNHPAETSAMLRTSYVTPDYVLGWFTIDETEEYMGIHTQNHWMGAITGTSPESRVVVQLTPGSDERTGYQELQAVGDENAVLIRKQQDATAGEQMRVYVSSDFTYQEQGGWVFGESGDGNSYFAVQGLLPSGAASYQVTTVSTTVAPLGGKWFQFDDEDAVVLLQMGRSEEFTDLNAFKADILANSITWDPGDGAVQYQAGAGASTLKMFTDNQLPQVGGTTVDLTPANVYDSPYLHGVQGSNLVTVTGLGGEILDLDFSYDPVAPLQTQLHQSNFTLQGEVFSPGYRGLVGVTQAELEPGFGSNFTYGVGSTGVLEIDVDGKNLVADRLSIAGDLSLDGELRVNWVRDLPQQGAVFTILEADQISGQFSTVVLPTLKENLFWQTENLHTMGQIEIAEGEQILLGDQDGSVFNGPGSADDVPVDPAWASQFSGFTLGMFDEQGANLTRLASFDITAADPTEIVAARLEIKLGQLAFGFENDFLTLDDLGNTMSLSSLGSLDPGALNMGSVLYYEFTNDDLNLLDDGMLNIAIQDDTAIDWVRFAWLIPAGIPGDFDADGDVDGADFLLWQRNPAVGDLADWEANLGTVALLSAAVSATIPEPSTISLLLVLVSTCLLRRQRCSQFSMLSLS